MSEVLNCEICGCGMKTRINGSHLKRKHGITLDEYKSKFPNAIIGKRNPNHKKYVCEIDGKLCKNSSSLSRHLNKNYDMSLENYYIEYKLGGKQPMCKCGCGEFTAFKNMEIGFCDYIIRHAPVWNVGLTKDNDDRVKNSNAGGWQKGLTKNTNSILKIHSKKLSEFWENNPDKKLEMVENYKKTMLEKYGVDNFSKTEEFVEKFENTCLERYGVTNPYFSNKCKWKFKNYTLPSGRIVKLQGYENYAVDFLLLEFSENDITYENEDIPSIPYIENEKDRNHKPDLYIHGENLLIEVKSTFTFGLHEDNVLLKQKFAKELGYDYHILIFDRKGNLIKKYE